MKKVKVIIIVFAAILTLPIIVFYLFIQIDGGHRAEFEYGLDLPNGIQIVNSNYSDSRVEKLLFGKHFDGRSSTSFIMNSVKLGKFLSQFEGYKHFCGNSENNFPQKGKIELIWDQGKFECLLLQPRDGFFRRKPYGDYLKITITKTSKEEELLVRLESDWN